jgi:hypothetical protein
MMTGKAGPSTYEKIGRTPKETLQAMCSSVSASPMAKDEPEAWAPFMIPLCVMLIVPWSSVSSSHPGPHQGVTD